MKLALVTETYPPEVNGVAMTLNRLADGLAARGSAVEVVRPRQKGEEPAKSKPVELVDDHPRVKSWLVAGVPIPFYRALRLGLPYWGALVRHWAGAKPDIVHIATEGPLGWAALRAARKLKLPTTSSFHTNFHQYGGHYGMRFGREIALWYLRRFHNRTACTMVPTAEMRERLQAQGFERLTVLGRGVDGNLYSPSRGSEALRTSWGAAPGDLVAICVGRLAAEKNLNLVVKTFLTLQALEPGAKLILVGDGPERASLQARYPQFHYAGIRSGEDLAAHYASADLFVFASTTETFGNVITEAMASGLVVLAYDYAAAREYLKPGLNGYTARLGDETGYLAAAGRAYAQRSAWPKIRSAARATAQTITWEAIVTRFEDELLQIARLHGAPGKMRVAQPLTWAE